MHLPCTACLFEVVADRCHEWEWTGKGLGVFVREGRDIFDYNKDFDFPPRGYATCSYHLHHWRLRALKFSLRWMGRASATFSEVSLAIGCTPRWSRWASITSVHVCWSIFWSGEDLLSSERQGDRRRHSYGRNMFENVAIGYAFFQLTSTLESKPVRDSEVV